MGKQNNKQISCFSYFRKAKKDFANRSTPPEIPDKVYDTIPEGFILGKVGADGPYATPNEYEDTTLSIPKGQDMPVYKNVSDLSGVRVVQPEGVVNENTLSGERYEKLNELDDKNTKDGEVQRNYTKLVDSLGAYFSKA